MKEQSQQISDIVKLIRDESEYRHKADGQIVLHIAKSEDEIHELGENVKHINDTVIRIHQTMELTKGDKKEIMDAMEKDKKEVMKTVKENKVEVMGYAKSRFNTLWAMGTVLVLVGGFVINTMQNNYDNLREEFALLRDEHVYLQSNQK